MQPILLLWDIDGTLIPSNGAGEESLRKALVNRYGILDDIDDVEIAGRTDISIAMEICSRHPDHGMEPLEFLDAYLEQLPIQLREKRGNVCPGVREFLEQSKAHPEIHNGLLTGNMRRGATIKLNHYGLNDFFRFGAFADDSPDRNNLGPVALERACHLFKKTFHRKSTWVIGDTPRDIECARALGCKVLAVSTGRYSITELRKYQPDLALPDLSDSAAILTELREN